MSFRFVRTQRVTENSKKNSKKFQKMKKPSYDFFSSQNRLEKAEKERKQKLYFRSVPTRRKYKIPKKEKKKKKIKKYHCGFISCQNRLEKGDNNKK